MASLAELCEDNVDLNSSPFKKCWSGVLGSSSVTIDRTLSPHGWKNLMTILNQKDVSQIQHLVVGVSAGGVVVSPFMECFREVSGMVELGEILSTGRFAGLKTLTIRVSPGWGQRYADGVISGVGHKASASIAAALGIGQFTNLQKLFLPACDAAMMLGALKEGQISHLSSLSIMNNHGLRTMVQSDPSPNLDAVLRSGYFKSLQDLDLSDGVLDEFSAWEVFTEAIKSGLLPHVTSLSVSNSGLTHVDFTDLVDRFQWFSSLENLTMDRCGIVSEQVNVMVAATLMKGSATRLALKCLDLHDNMLRDDAVRALVKLVDRMPQLELDLRKNNLDESATLTLTGTVNLDRLRRQFYLRL